jgi:hypothetical protein
MRLPRMTTRPWMALVALTAAILSAGMCQVRMGRMAQGYRFRSTDFIKHAELDHEHAVNTYNSRILAEVRLGQFLEDPPNDRTVQLIRSQEVQIRTLERWIDLHDRRAEYFGRLARKYERAARYPWLPVPPDPPEPK